MYVATLFLAFSVPILAMSAWMRPKTVFRYTMMMRWWGVMNMCCDSRKDLVPYMNMNRHCCFEVINTLATKAISQCQLSFEQCPSSSSSTFELSVCNLSRGLHW
ncbi:hypothetical protein BU25DRAFT_411534 [Macroventuria anomochaeta]|uniref:Uncharacterized protein n=1 Tax=Macroventuria anomochaeta TaxID=301207 RepID=A0ACB6RWZ1_9PLEO|nr:uncharacterized protein BU25DRAFT_411534 [Macroventuria anomochaeta]KAF2626556.1 hypothetical protein BU25DRAFT_411534 [Macroventuria anomochaeta]